MGVREITFMGGETTLRTDVEEIFAFVKKQGMALSFVTNGLRFADPVFAAKILKFADFVAISIHSAEKNMYRALSGIDGFGIFLKGLNHINMYNRCAALVFNFVPNSINASKIVDAIRLIQKMRWKTRYFFNIKKLMFRGKVRTRPELLLADAQLRQHLLRALAYAAKNRIGMVVDNFPLCIYEGFEYLSLELVCELLKYRFIYGNRYLLSKDTTFLRPATLLERARYLIRCDSCSLKRICPGVDREYFKAKDFKCALTPQKKKLRSVIYDFLRKNLFFNFDYFCHPYRFEALFGKNGMSAKYAKALSCQIEEQLLV